MSRLSALALAYLGLALRSIGEAGLYSFPDEIVVLRPGNVEAVLVNSSTAVLAEFYASWCGACIRFGPTYRALAQDVHDWKPAVELAHIDCADATNTRVCTHYGIRKYPTLKFFNAYSTNDSLGESVTAYSDARILRHEIINQLEAHPEPAPPACPPLEPISLAELNSFFETNDVKHLALIFEESTSYVGKEVTLDLLRYENVTVRRVLRSEEDLVAKLMVTDFPSCYLYYPEGNATRLRVKFEARAYYTNALRGLPGVVRSGKPKPLITDMRTNTTEKWRPFNSSKVYMADMEAALDYSLRVELAIRPAIRGVALSALKSYISVLTKYFPGRPMVTGALKRVDSWLQAQEGEVSYGDFRRVLDNNTQVPNGTLPEEEIWVGCQGSKSYFRRYPCGMWTLLHVLTVQAKHSDDSEPKAVLTAIAGYVQELFGCRECADHFGDMIKESLHYVTSLSGAVLWLWSAHNQVNSRVAGEPSEDPLFPKIQWPSLDLCPACHGVTSTGEHNWDLDKVLPFVLFHFSAGQLQMDYLDNESEVLAKQRKRLETAHQEIETRRGAERKAREALPAVSQPPVEAQGTEEEEEEGEEEEDEVEQEEPVVKLGDVGGEEKAAAAVDEMGAESAPWANKPDVEVAGRGRWRSLRKPGMAGLRLRDTQEDIVDLDSFVNQHFKAKALRAASAAAVPQVKSRTLQRKVEQDSGPIFGLRMELDVGVGMVGLEPAEPDFDSDNAQRRQQRTWLQKRELSDAYMTDGEKMDQWYVQNPPRGRWISVLNIGFSRLDISLCVILYFLSSLCLMAMYLFFKNRLRIRRVKVSIP